jgi:integrase/recombinase XerD
MSYPLALAPGHGPGGGAAAARVAPAPVEYAVAVEEYLAQAALSAASRRVYRISLTGWAWPLAGKAIPAGTRRRAEAPPVLPLALLDDPAMPGRLAAAAADRAAATDARTVNRELSALRSAIGWWRDQRWIDTDPTAGLRHLRAGPAAAPPLTGSQVDELLRLTVGLREHALWRLLYDTGAPAGRILGLDGGELDLGRHRIRIRPDQDTALAWTGPTSQILRWLLAGRTYGPVFLTDRRAPAQTPAADRCPVTGRGRMSYRRAEEIFIAATRPLDPAGQGWTLHQLRDARTSRTPIP